MSCRQRIRGDEDGRPNPEGMVISLDECSVPWDLRVSVLRGRERTAELYIPVNGRLSTLTLGVYGVIPLPKTRSLQ